jgi:pimeloyl-ACP methyl ester carboxylesterase
MIVQAPDGADGIDIHVEGDGADTVVMVHGWPDTYRLWDAQVAFLKSRYRCVRFTLPGFDIAKEPRAFSIDQIAEFLRQVVERVSPGRKVTLLLHDWGCAFGYQFYARYPELVARIVGVDIGDTRGLKHTLTPRAKLLMMAYQWWLSLAWFVGGRLGDRMALRMKRWMRSRSDERFIGSCMCYPYYLTWFGGRRSYRPQFKRFAPSCPMLFIYAKRKPFMFHTQAWIDNLVLRKENRVIAFDTGHWVMLQQPERFNEAVGGWLSATAVIP